jgi:hypothetical protein
VRFVFWGGKRERRGKGMQERNGAPLKGYIYLGLVFCHVEFK